MFVTLKDHTGKTFKVNPAHVCAVMPGVNPQTGTPVIGQSVLAMTGGGMVIVAGSVDSITEALKQPEAPSLKLTQ